MHEDTIHYFDFHSILPPRSFAFSVFWPNAKASYDASVGWENSNYLYNFLIVLIYRDAFQLFSSCFPFMFLINIETLDGCKLAIKQYRVLYTDAQVNHCCFWLGLNTWKMFTRLRQQTLHTHHSWTKQLSVAHWIIVEQWRDFFCWSDWQLSPTHNCVIYPLSYSNPRY